ncbi:hypothetical protein P873_04565 [Arenimonas composti TR7-09 = DSM 18010]|uniref:Uncharacterized protein n=1 Tax=Arenimonas composti TR7-09 = DSM 18010 TaxID=1121013 RepID=A0A091BED3_9GAMM|nr:hypothetical protein P873_04565 [Arenimonas composti TR7-09 = DSM 18010]
MEERLVLLPGSDAGVSECSAMSEVLMVAHMRDSLGIPRDEDDLIGADGITGRVQ